MSFIFEINGETVWAPALGVGTAYASCAQALGTTVGTGTGVHAHCQGLHRDRRGRLRSTRALLALASNSNHPVMVPLIDAVLIPSLVMLERVGSPIDLGTDPERRAAVEALRNMPR